MNQQNPISDRVKHKIKWGSDIIKFILFKNVNEYVCLCDTLCLIITN